MDNKYLFVDGNIYLGVQCCFLFVGIVTMFYQHAIDPIALSLGPLNIYWYGVMYLLAFTFGFWYGDFRIRRYPFITISKKEWSDFLTWAVIGVVVGGRSGYVFFYQFSNFLENPLYLFRIWEGGMSFHGGLIGVFVAIVIFERTHNKKVLELADFVTPVVPVGLFFGRIGNFIGGELWGKPTDVPWAVIFPMHDMQPRHPSQLYEMILEGVLLCIIMLVFSAKKRPRFAASGLFLMGYGFFRILVEFVREPDAHIGYLAFDIITMGHVLSLPMVLAGFILFVLAYMRKQEVLVTPVSNKKKKKKRGGR